MSRTQIRIAVKYRIRDLSPKRRTTEWIITAIPPEEGTDYYGTGYYITAVPIKDDGQLDGKAAILWDMRYLGTNDIQKMADAWVRAYYGEPIKQQIKYYVE